MSKKNNILFFVLIYISKNVSKNGFSSTNVVDIFAKVWIALAVLVLSRFAPQLSITNWMTWSASFWKLPCSCLIKPVTCRCSNSLFVARVPRLLLNQNFIGTVSQVILYCNSYQICFNWVTSLAITQRFACFCVKLATAHQGEKGEAASW